MTRANGLPPWAQWLHMGLTIALTIAIAWAALQSAATQEDLRELTQSSQEADVQIVGFMPLFNITNTTDETTGDTWNRSYVALWVANFGQHDTALLGTSIGMVVSQHVTQATNAALLDPTSGSFNLSESHLGLDRFTAPIKAGEVRELYAWISQDFVERAQSLTFTLDPVLGSQDSLTVERPFQSIHPHQPNAPELPWLEQHQLT